MGRVVIRTEILAPIERCFDLARDVEVHCRTSAFTSERVLPPGRTSGLLELGESVIFEGRHFGLRLRLTAQIVQLDRPSRFVDEVVDGAFDFLRHSHEFSTLAAGTEMVDTLDWRAPFGVLGKVADALFLERHLAWYVTKKQQELKAIAEGEGTAGRKP